MKQLTQKLSTLLLTSAIAGCVVYPTERTYFEPNLADGKPERSQSCGYHNASDDSLVRDIAQVHMKVTPIYDEASKIRIVLSFRSVENNINITAKQIGLKDVEKNQIYFPENIESNVTYPDRIYPDTDTLYYTRWYYLTYPIHAESLNAISIMFNAGSVVLSGNPIKIDEFRFNRVTKSDVYYGSINC